MRLRIINVVFVFLVSLFLLLGSRVIHAQDNNQKLQELQKQIEEYQNEITRLKGQAVTLTNQIAQFDAQIKLTTLRISETEEKIVMLTGRIGQLEVSLDALSKAFSSRAAETYKMARIDEPFLFVMSAPDITSAVSRFFYLRKIQQSDRDLMIRLQSAQTIYQGQKNEQQELQKELQVQKDTLDSQKRAKASLLEVTHNDERRFQQLLSQARSQLAALRRFVTSQGGATILSNQTKCDNWGCYYNQRDSQWGTIGIGGSSYSVAEYGCLISSIAMLATHSGKNMTPADIAVNPNYFVPGTGYIYHSAEAMPFTINTASASRLDSLLASGPVIAGLYSGPDHFIVILRKDGDNYIMNDPFLENGGERNLTDKYSISDITTLRLVQFN